MIHFLQRESAATFRSRSILGISRIKFSTSVANCRGQTLVEKIAQRYAAQEQTGRIFSGDFVSIRPHHVMTHDNTAAVMKKFIGLQVPIANSRQPVFTVDHDIQNKSDQNLKKYASIESFANEHGVDFYPPGRGIGHQVMLEQGYAFPQTLTVASDSHSNMYGGVGCLGTPIVRTDAAGIWATGTTWWQVPSVVKVELKGKLQPGICGKDIIVALCGLFNQDQVLNAAVEFMGEGVQQLTIDDRLTIANMTTEWGALAGVFPVDGKTISWLKEQQQRLDGHYQKYKQFADQKTVPSLQAQRDSHPRINARSISELEKNILKPDNDAFYSKILTLDLSTLRDQAVAGPNSVKVMQPLSNLSQKGIAIQKAYLLSCTNSRASDIREAAQVFSDYAKQKKTDAKVADGVEFYVAAASSHVQSDVEQSGHWQQLLDAGARPLPPGCGPCIGLGTGLLKDGEVGISATNRNFKGRMGSRSAEAYLASPAVVAASALAGRICGPHELFQQDTTTNQTPRYSIQVCEEPPKQESVLEILPGFPEEIKGELLFCPADNMNTDAIYAGKHTYNDNMTPEQMAQVVMENYDPKFREIQKPQDILISGRNFGSGSSREQAATSLKYAGIPLLLAYSFSETFKRNALNNGVLCLEAPKLVQDLLKWREQSQNKDLTIRSGILVRILPGRGKIEVTGTGSLVNTISKKQAYAIPAVGQIAQELVLAGGLESWIQQKSNNRKTAN